VPLSTFVNSRFKPIAASADIAIHGGEPRYKSYISTAKKTGCKLALWGCEAGWISRCHETLPLFDIIFANGKDSLAALREAGYENAILPPKTPGTAPSAPPPSHVPPPEPESPPAPPTPGGLSEPGDDAGGSPPMIDLANLPRIEPLGTFQSEDSEPSSVRFSSASHAYGVVNRNENVRAASAAGGVFTLLCEEIINKGGVVFGAVYNDSFETVHAKAERMPECVPMRGVKYAISDTKGIYKRAVSSLRQGKRVLFTGTACQIARLYATLGDGTSFSHKNDHPRLLTADVVCGGAADPKVFSAYLKYVAEKNGGHATAVDLSSKPMGMGRACVRIGSESNTYEVPVNRDPFIRAYRAGLCLRPECYDCPHQKSKRGSDLTLASFPGGKKHIPELCDDKGASLVLAHSQKGREMMESLAHRSIVREIPPDALSDYNSAVTTVPEKHKNRDGFYGDIKIMRFDKAVANSIGSKFQGISAVKESILSVWEKIRNIRKRKT
jgi:coenzyme F420-reducing hydrogenase beta subunit